jgi:hypothetical protein
MAVDSEQSATRAERSEGHIKRLEATMLASQETKEVMQTAITDK